MALLLREVLFVWRDKESAAGRQNTLREKLVKIIRVFKYWREACWEKSWLLIVDELYSICLSCTDDLSDLRRAVMSSSWVARTAARDTGHTLVRVLDHTVVSAMSTSTEVTLNLILAVLRCHTMVLLTLEALHNTTFLRVDINIVILIIQKNTISYNEIDLSWGCKN